jgi:hypothetical protein
MERSEPDKSSPTVSVALASPHIPFPDPAADGTDVALFGSFGGRFTFQGPLFANGYTCTAINAFLFNNRSSFYHTNSANRTVPDAKTTTVTFSLIHFHIRYTPISPLSRAKSFGKIT